ncbi:unnamed protein product, partial [Arabidopsis halleri]
PSPELGWDYSTISWCLYYSDNWIDDWIDAKFSCSVSKLGQSAKFCYYFIELG